MDLFKGLGIQFLDQSTTDIKKESSIPNRYIKPQSIERFVSTCFSQLKDGLSADSKKIYAKYYNTTIDNLPIIDVFRRTGSKAYKAPHVLVKEGLSNWEICATYIDENCSFNSKVFGIHHPDTNLLKGITCLLNSKFALYYIFLTSASIGIEREEIKPNELYDLPLFLNVEDFYEMATFYDEYTTYDVWDKDQKIAQLESIVDNYIFQKLALLKGFDISVIEDFISYTLPLLKKDVKQISLPAKNENIIEYANSLTNEVNNFLEGQNLFVNATVYDVNRFTPLMMVKLSFSDEQKSIFPSKEFIDTELRKLDTHLWVQKSSNIYFRKKMNYKTGNDIYIIRSNQRRFWSRSMAIEDASEMILEILNEN